MLALFMLVILVFACLGMYAYFSAPRYRTFRSNRGTFTSRGIVPPEDQVSISVNAPVTGVTWVSRPPQTVIIEEEEIFVDSPIDPLDLMMDAMLTEEIIEEGPTVIDSGYGYGADALDNSYDGGVGGGLVEEDDIDFGGGDIEF